MLSKIPTAMSFDKLPIISAEDIKSMESAKNLSDATLIFTKICEALLDFFCSTHRREARELLFKLIHVGSKGGFPENSDKEQLQAIIRLHAIAPENWMGNFQYKINGDNIEFTITDPFKSNDVVLFQRTLNLNTATSDNQLFKDFNQAVISQAAVKFSPRNASGISEEEAETLRKMKAEAKVGVVIGEVTDKEVVANYKTHFGQTQEFAGGQRKANGVLRVIDQCTTGPGNEVEAFEQRNNLIHLMLNHKVHDSILKKVQEQDSSFNAEPSSFTFTMIRQKGGDVMVNVNIKNDEEKKYVGKFNEYNVLFIVGRKDLHCISMQSK